MFFLLEWLSKLLYGADAVERARRNSPRRSRSPQSWRGRR
jgi:hypothetical protein